MAEPRTSAILVLAFSCLTLGHSVRADQVEIPSYSAATKQAYMLYVGASPSESADIYCGVRFRPHPMDPRRRPTDWLSLEHAYPADWMADVFGCNSRTDCRKHRTKAKRNRFNHAEDDLHNFWPALANLNSARGKRLFGELPGSETREIDLHGRTFVCDFQLEGNIVEPRTIARGNFARSIFYMCSEYGFPVDTSMFATLKRWNRDDPPTLFERERNRKIEKI